MTNEPQLQGVSGPAISCAWVMPYLMAIWCCLAILQGSPTHIPPIPVLLATVGVALISTFFLHSLLWLTIRKAPARELILFALVSCVGLYGGFGVIASQYIGWYPFTGVWIVLHLAFIVFAFRYGQHERTANFIPVAALAIGLTLGFQVFGVGLPIANDSSQIAQLMSEISKADTPPKEKTADSDQRPDIYYIIVDAYAGQTVLEEVYGFDNQPFIDALRERGFFVADESRSNYHLTELSVASSLNMTHLNHLKLEKFKTRIPIRQMIADSRVVRYLSEHGYQTIGFESGKSDTECENFDRYVPVGNALNDYQDVLYHGTLVPTLLELSGIPHRSAARRHGDRTIETLKLIPSVVKDESTPTFVFSHLLAPHPPFVNDNLGQAVDFHGHYLLADAAHFTACYDYDLDVYRKAYRNQVAFINQKLLKMIDGIQDSDRDAVIIIQADHGPRLGFGADPSAGVDPNNLNMPYQEAFSILNAVCMPDGMYPRFYPSMTPVNTFSLIFNEMFQAELALQADDSFYEENYVFENVTHKSLPRNLFTETAVTKKN